MFNRSGLWGSSGASLGLLLLVGCASNDGADPSLGSNAEQARGPSHGGRGRGVARPPRGHGHGPGAGGPRGGQHPGRPGHHPGHGHHHGPGCGHPPAGTGGTGGSGNPGSGGSGAASSAGMGSGSGASGGAFPGSGGSTGGTFGSGGSAGGAGFPGSGVCGDGVQDWFEQCDDANLEEGDGCDAGCAVEGGYSCDSWSGCHRVVCGDGVQDWYANGDGTFGNEGCDDANAAAGDGCSDACQLEPGFTCSDGPGAPCREVICGDGFLDGYFLPGTGGTGGAGGTGSGGTFSAGAGGGGGFVTWFYEGCDDGNPSSADGCSSTCDVEPGYICDVPGTSCRIPVCGDGRQDFILTGGTGGTGGTGNGSGGSFASGGFAGSGLPSGSWESCDDGNVTSADGCSGVCELESGWICDAPGIPCRQPRCGDGRIDFIGSGGAGGSGGTGAGGFAGQPGGGYEQCDDGNGADDDGCTSSCALEPGWACQNPGSACHLAVCGDGIWDWPVEDCDDGNDVDGDGCSDCRYDFSGAGGSAGSGGTGFGGFGFSGSGGSGG
jgi:cysteine-rich repeat protein